MFRKELMKAGLIATISLLCLTGCSGQEKPKPDETTSVETETDGGETYEGETDEGETGKEPQETTTGEEVIGKFDPADVCKNISINGELVEFPWTLNKLGDEYEFDNITNDYENDGISATDLLYNNKPILIASIADDEVDRNSEIVAMLFEASDNISIYNLGKGATKEDVMKKLGEPNEKQNDGIFVHYIYICNEMKLDFEFFEGILSSTWVNIYADWN